MATTGKAAAIQPIPDPLDLQSAIDIALEGHPGLAAAEAEIEARAGSARQAAAAPNPVLSVQTENWRFHGDPAFSAARSLDLFAFVRLPVETGGKRARRVRLAEVDQRIAGHRRGLAVWTVRQRVKTAYWQALAAASRATVLAQSRETLRELEAYHEARVRLGEMPEASLIRVRVEAGRASLALARAEMEVIRSKLALVEAMGIPALTAGFELAESGAGRIAAHSADRWAVDEALGSALGHRPEIFVGEAEVERARASLELERSRARPNFTPYLGYKRTNALDTVIGGVSVSLPVRDKNAGSIDEAVAELRQREADLRALQARVQSEVVAAVESVRRRSDMLRAMEADVLEGARETSRIALAAYEEGGAQLLDVLDAKRAQNAVELLHSELRFDYRLSRIHLETVLGAPESAVAVVGSQPTVARVAGAVQ